MTDRIQINFEAFHRDNPQVYTLFDRFTRQMIARGYEHGSIALITERIRWETAVETSGDLVKLNNNYKSRYARLWEADHPEHTGFFRKRELRAFSVDSVDFHDLI